MKKYSTKKMIISKIVDLTDCDEVVDNVGIKCIINQELINKVFRAKKRFKNKYDSQANKVYIYKSIKPMSKTSHKIYSKESLSLLKMKPKIVQ